MKILGIDYGDKRIGLAMSDALCMIAGGLDTVTNEGQSKSACIVTEIIKKEKVSRVVIGFPKNMNNTLGTRAEITDRFIELLKEKNSDIEVIKWDERLSSVSAGRAMRDMGAKKKTKRDKGNIDKISAIIILQGYLDSVAMR